MNSITNGNTNCNTNSNSNNNNSVGRLSRSTAAARA
jgi:hypothetical protein